eukprot:scaffold10307_cov120-Isochrysis_galbana.AAC.1
MSRPGKKSDGFIVCASLLRMLHLNARAAPASALHHVSGGATRAPEQTLITPVANRRGNKPMLAATSPLPRVRRAGASL